ncbi:MAG: hypothetical protein ACXVB9_16195 [Bdellovibrionota bacterium]
MLAACASAPVSPSVSRDFLAEIAKNTEKRGAVSGNLLVTGEFEGKSVTTPAVLLVEYPDKLRLELQDPVGGILVLLVLNGDRCWLYQRDRDVIYTGAASRLPFGMIPHLSPQELVRVFLARPDADHLSRSAPLGEGKAQYRSGDLLETILWDSSLAEPSEWRISHAGKGGSSALYENYEFKSGLRYPTKIRLAASAPGGVQREIALAWKDWEPSVPKEKKLFQIPQQESFGRKIKALP